MTVKIAVLQMNVSENPHHNAQTIMHYANIAREHQMKHLFLPENANFIHSEKDYCLTHAISDTRTDFMNMVRETAQDNQIYIHIGSVKYKISDTKLSNRSVSVSPDGNIIATYDKIHLFDANISETEIYRESDLYQAGTTPTLLYTDTVNIGLTICYDVRFAHLYQILAQNHAHIITVPAAFTVPTGHAHWDVLLRCRAIETGCYIIAAAQCGTHYGGRKTYGHSVIINPWGEIIAQQDGESVGLIYADIDIDNVTKSRQKLPVLQHIVPFTPIKIFK
jgi:deaminated glutathione amidase